MFSKRQSFQLNVTKEKKMRIYLKLRRLRTHKHTRMLQTNLETCINAIISSERLKILFRYGLAVDASEVHIMLRMFLMYLPP